MPAFDAPPQTGPGKGTSLHGNDQQVTERRTLRDYYVILRERLWVALPIALLVAISLGYYQAKETPMYSSVATMQFERPEHVVLNEQVVDSSIRSEADLNTHLKFLESSRLRSMVAQSLTPDEAKILQRPYLKDLPPGTTPPAPASIMG